MIAWPLKVVRSLAEAREWGNHTIFQCEKTGTPNRWACEGGQPVVPGL